MDSLGVPDPLLPWAASHASIVSLSARNSSRQAQVLVAGGGGNVSREAVSVSVSSTRTDEILNAIDAEKENNSDFQLIKKTFGDASGNAIGAEGGSGDAPVHASRPYSAKAPSGQSAGAETPVEPPPAKISTSLTHSESSSTSVSAETQAVKQSDPLTLDLNGNGIETSGLDKGSVFDINGDGAPDRTSFAAGGDGVLAMDHNGNGVIDSGRELFGDQNGSQNGYAELARYDQNGDGWIDAKDPVFNDLILLIGEGADTFRVSGAMTLTDAGVKAIGLKYDNATGKTSGGDDTAQTGVFMKSDGTAGKTADVLLSNVSVYA